MLDEIIKGTGRRRKKKQRQCGKRLRGMAYERGLGHSEGGWGYGDSKGIEVYRGEGGGDDGEEGRLRRRVAWGGGSLGVFGRRVVISD